MSSYFTHVTRNTNVNVIFRNLISEVSKAANVLSKYTTLVTIDDKCDDGEVLSAMQCDDQTRFVSHTITTLIAMQCDHQTGFVFHTKTTL